MKVLAQGICVLRTNERRPSDAPFRMTPLPAMIMGKRASLMISAARASCDASGSESFGCCTGSGSPSASDAATSSGKSMCVAPNFSVCATLNALRTTSGMMWGVVIWALNLVIGLNRATRSIAWCDSLCRRLTPP